MLEGVSLIARLVLAGLFLIAGVAKLIDQNGSRKAVVDFGLPSVLSAQLAVLLPVTEMSIGIALLPAATAWWGALGALVLLGMFIVAIVANLARGRKPDCHCFGQIASRPIGRQTLLRNVLLAGIAALVAWQGPDSVGPSALMWLDFLRPSEVVIVSFGVVIFVLLIGIGWLLLQLWQLIGRLLLRIDELEARLTGHTRVPTPAQAVGAGSAQGLPVGTPAPNFNLVGVSGESLTIDALRARGKPVLLLFTDPNCGPCTTLMPEVGRWQRDYVSAFTLAVISTGTAEANKAKAAEHNLARVLLQKEHEVGDAYQAYGTPSAVLVRPDGTIGSRVAAGAEGVRALITEAGAGAPRLLPVIQAAPKGNGYHGQSNGHDHARHVPSIATQVGQPAPILKLPDLDGNLVELAHFKDKTLVLFWNPGCGFCQQMLGDLKRWEANPPKHAPKLLLVSTGSTEDNREMGLRSSVVIEPSFSAGLAFGVTGTPSAVLVDEGGSIASEVAVGAAAVLKLAGQAQPVYEHHSAM